MMGAMGWIFAVILVAFFLPLGAMLYLDILDATHEVKAQTEKIEKLRREIERKNRDKNSDMFGDNPVFDRLRRPLEIPMSKPSKLGKD
jgi:cell division protein FtsB